MAGLDQNTTDMSDTYNYLRNNHISIMNEKA